MTKKLTNEERIMISIAKVGASNEVEELIRVIERITGEKIVSADEKS